MDTQLKKQNEEFDSSNTVLVSVARNMHTMAMEFQNSMDSMSDSDQVTELLGSYRDEVEMIFKEMGQAGIDALISKFELLPGSISDILTNTVNQAMEELDKVQDKTDQLNKKTGPKMATSLGQSLVEFASYIEQAQSNAARAVHQFGVDSDDAGETFKESVIDQAEETVSNLIDTFEDPQMRNNFIESLRSLGQSAGNELYVAVANALDQTNQLVGDSGIISDTLKNYGLKNESLKNWDVEVVDESQTQTLYKVTDGVSELFHTVMKGKNDVSGFDWVSALDIEGMQGSLQNGLSGMSNIAGDQGQIIWDQLSKGIKSGVDAAVAYAKQKIAEINVPGGSSSSSGKTLAVKGRSVI
jgi:hypothetical protein